ncbi:MAG: hypothetical protein ACXWQQ_01500 [Pseudobdellovibrio sp.]
MKKIIFLACFFPFFTVFADNQRLDQTVDATKQYIEILEKTNAQMSLWYNPYGLMVAALSLLLAALAIGVAFVLYKQSRDHKLQLEAERKTRQDEFENFLKERTNSAKKLVDELAARSEKQFDQLINEQKSKLTKSVSNSKEDILKIEKRIEELENQKANVPIGAAQVVAAEWDNNPLSVFSGITNNVHKCSACGYGFKVQMNDPYLGVVRAHSLSGKASVTCPKCNNVDSVYGGLY